MFNFTKILGFFWDVGYTVFDSLKDVAFAKILVFSNIFDFPEVNLAPKWNKIVNLGTSCFK